jgi:hypothetical protein
MLQSRLIETEYTLLLVESLAAVVDGAGRGIVNGEAADQERRDPSGGPYKGLFDHPTRLMR